MNLIVFEPDEIGKPLSARDRRAKHIREVLRLVPGDEFEAGVLNGPMGKMRLVSMTDTELLLKDSFTIEPAPLFPVTLIIGFPRPIAGRRLLKDLTTLGVECIRFAGTDLGEKSYRDSTLWKGEYLEHVKEGAEQAFTTRIPRVFFHWNVDAAIRSIEEGAVRIVLDNEKPDRRLSGIGRPAGRCVLAVGSERGWSEDERGKFRAAGFLSAGLGERVLRTETACISAVTLVLAALGFM